MIASIILGAEASGRRPHGSRAAESVRPSTPAVGGVDARGNLHVRMEEVSGPFAAPVAGA